MILSRKRIVVIAAAVLFSLIVLGVSVGIKKSSSGSKEITVETVENKNSGVAISNFNTYSGDVPNIDQKNILEALSLRLATDSAEGAIRTSSYKKTTANNAVTIQFIVDFPSLKKSLKIYSVRGSDGFNPTYVMCPEKNEFIYSTDICSEGVNDEK